MCIRDSTSCSGTTRAILATWERGNARVPQPNDAHVNPNFHLPINQARRTPTTTTANCTTTRPNIIVPTIPARYYFSAARFPSTSSSRLSTGPITFALFSLSRWCTSMTRPASVVKQMEWCTSSG